MAGTRLNEMGPGQDRYRASLLFGGWPSIATQTSWDATHTRILVRFADAAARRFRRKAGDLARRLVPTDPIESTSPVPTTMASVRYRYLLAGEIAAHLSDFCDRLEEPALFFTVIPDYGEVDDPDDLDALWMKERLRNDLNDRGALGSDGILYAVVEAEYQMRTGRWRFHWHGVASGGKLRAVNGLRELKAYHTPRRRPDERKAAVPYRIKVCSRPLFNLPKPLTYCIKPWFARWENDEGERSRRRRMPREAIPAMLLWQDEWSISDITLLMGLRPGRNGFVIIGSTRMKGSDL